MKHLCLCAVPKKLNYSSPIFFQTVMSSTGIFGLLTCNNTHALMQQSILQCCGNSWLRSASKLSQVLWPSFEQGPPQRSYFVPNRTYWQQSIYLHLCNHRNPNIAGNC